jgi:hypothetical protein
MKRIVLLTAFAMVFGLAAFAQSPTPGDPQSNPQSTTAPSPQPQTTPSPSPDMPSAGSQNQAPPKVENGEKKLKGCIASEGGKYILQSKHGKEIVLTGSEDFASHVGHTVTVRGTLTNSADSTGAASSATATSTGTSSDTASAGEQLKVSKIEMVSDTCKEKDKEKDKSKN